MMFEAIKKNLKLLIDYMKPKPTLPQPGQESVWDYPRPAILQDTDKHLKVICNSIVLLDSSIDWHKLEQKYERVYDTEHAIPDWIFSKIAGQL